VCAGVRGAAPSASSRLAPAPPPRRTRAVGWRRQHRLADPVRSQPAAATAELQLSYEQMEGSKNTVVATIEKHVNIRINCMVKIPMLLYGKCMYTNNAK
jgi:hypothetical protein